MSSDSTEPPAKRVGGIKVVVKKKTKTSKRKLMGGTIRTTTRGLPEHHYHSHQESDDAPPIPIQEHHEPNDDFPIDEDDLPCDTLLAIRSLAQSRQCLDVPLFVGSVPCVLESQLERMLQPKNGEDSVVTTELQDLSQSNKIRRLTSTRGDIVVAAVMETRHYKRAVWDAHRHYDGACPKITAAFLSCLDQTMKRRISAHDLRQYWPEPWNDSVVHTLVRMQVLLPVQDAYMLWLPYWGLVLKQLSKAQQKVIQQLKRSLYKELSRSQVERLHHTGLSGQFVLHTLVAQGLVELQDRPSGMFVKLLK